MTIKTILLPRDQAEITTEVLATSLAVAQQFHAHLELLLLRRDPGDTMPFVFSTLSSSNLRQTVLEAAQQSENERAKQIRQSFDEFCAKHNIAIVDTPPGPTDSVSASWSEGEDDALIRRGRLHDLIIIGRPDQHAPTTFETALLETKRPVLIAPPQVPITVGQRIAIGWNSSAEASQAVTDALPFMRHAANVTILTSQQRLQSTQELIAYLAWHGIQAEFKLFNASSHAIGEALLAEAQDINADLFVIGGYSHTRARQILFGGVTQHFIHKAELPVLMAH